MNNYYRRNPSFTTREEVGKALARAWFDEHYYNRLTDDVHQVFGDGGVNIQMNLNWCLNIGNNRASITIYEQQNGSNFRIRVCSLLLTMIARR